MVRSIHSLYIYKTSSSIAALVLPLNFPLTSHGSTVSQTLQCPAAHILRNQFLISPLFDSLLMKTNPVYTTSRILGFLAVALAITSTCLYIIHISSSQSPSHSPITVCDPAYACPIDNVLSDSFSALGDSLQKALHSSPLVTSQLHLLLSNNNSLHFSLCKVLHLLCDEVQNGLVENNISTIIREKEQHLAQSLLTPLSLAGGSYVRPDYVWPNMDGRSVHAIINQARTSISMQKREGIVRDLEEALEAKFHAKFAVTFPTGTLALYASFIAADVQPGDEIIVPAYTFHGTWSTLPSMGAVLVPVDLYDENSPHRIDGCMDPEKVVAAITAKTKAVVVTHMWGLVCDVETIEARIQEELKYRQLSNKIVIIEDAAHAHFATSPSSKYAGSLTNNGMGAFSLNGPKPLSAGEGGFVLTNDEALYHRLVFSMHYNKRCKLEIPPESPLHKFCSTGWGIKARIHPLAAALALHQLQFIAPTLVSRRSVVARRMELEFGTLRSVSIPRFPRINESESKLSTAVPSHYAFVLQYNAKAFGHRVSREDFVKEVQQQAILSENVELADLDMPSMRPIVEHNLYMNPNVIFPHFETGEVKKRRMEILLQSASVLHSGKNGPILISDYPESRKFFQRAIKIPVWHFLSTEERTADDFADERTMLRYVQAFRRAEGVFSEKYGIAKGQEGDSSYLCNETVSSCLADDGKGPSRGEFGNTTDKDETSSSLSLLVTELCDEEPKTGMRGHAGVNKTLCQFFSGPATLKILSTIVEKLRKDVMELRANVEVFDKQVLTEERDISQEDKDEYLAFFEKTKQLMTTNFAEYDDLFGKQIFKGKYSFSELLSNERVPWLKALKVFLKAEAFASTLVVERGNAFSAIKVFMGKGVILQMHNFDNPELQDDPHCHKKHFFSGLLVGEYKHRIWRVKDSKKENMNGVTLFECSKVDSLTQANPCRELPGKQLEVLMEHRHQTGQVLYIHSKTVHTVETSSNISPISVVLRSGKASTDTVYYQYFENDNPGHPVSGPGGLIKWQKEEGDNSDKGQARVVAFSKRKILSGREAVEVAKGFFEKLN